MIVNLAARNLKLCVNTGQGWSKVGYLLFPALDSDHTLKEASEVIRDPNNDPSVDGHSELVGKFKGRSMVTCCMSKKSRLIYCKVTNLVYKMSQDFLDRQYFKSR